MQAPHMSSEEFRRLGYRVVDWIASYQERLGDFPVAPRVKPGEIAAMLPEHPPEEHVPTEVDGDAPAQRRRLRQGEVVEAMPDRLLDAGRVHLRLLQGRLVC